VSDSQSRITLRDLDLAAKSAAVAPTPGTIGPGTRVTLKFSLRLIDANGEVGEIIDSNFDKSPVTFVVGDGNLLPGFEQALFGLAAGATRDATLEPEQAFGPVNEDNVQRFPLYQFPPDLALSPGLMVDFADAAGNNQAGIVRSIDKQWVEVDFNHPLAGRAIRFSAHVHEVSQT
jgi:FKBP-type peptidyl-prolyl cis-trans isomerase SlpA